MKAKVFSLQDACRRRGLVHPHLVHDISDGGELTVDAVDERGNTIETYMLDKQATEFLLINLVRKMAKVRAGLDHGGKPPKRPA